MPKPLTDENIMELLLERKQLRYSTLMVCFHISSTEAIKIVKEYKKNKIIDEDGRYVQSSRSSWRRRDAKFREEESRWNKENEMQEIESGVIKSVKNSSDSNKKTTKKQKIYPESKKSRKDMINGQLSFF